MSERSQDILETVAGISPASAEQSPPGRVDSERVRKLLSEAQKRELRRSWIAAASKLGRVDSASFLLAPKPTTRKLFELGLITRKAGYEQVRFSSFNWRSGGFHLTEAGLEVADALTPKSAAEYKREADERKAAQKQKREEREQKRAEREREILELFSEVQKRGLSTPTIAAQLANPRLQTSYVMSQEELIEVLRFALRSGG